VIDVVIGDSACVTVIKYSCMDLYSSLGTDNSESTVSTWRIIKCSLSGNYYYISLLSVAIRYVSD